METMTSKSGSRVYIRTFGGAIEALRDGEAVCREGWNDDHTLLLQVPDENSKMTQPYIYMITAQGAVLPWVASQTDILAIDWEIRK